MNYKKNKKTIIKYILTTLFVFTIILTLLTFILNEQVSVDAQNQGTPVSWINIQNTTNNGNSIQHNGTGYFAMGKTTQTISNAGYFEWTFDGDACVVGFGNGENESPNSGSVDLDFSLNYGGTSPTGAGDIRINGAYHADVPDMTPGQIFRIEIESNGDVIFKRNGVEIPNTKIVNPQKIYPYYLVFKAQNEAPFGQSISNVLTSGTGSGGGLISPTNLISTNESGNNINLSWLDNSTNETGFKVERKLGTQGVWSEIGTVGANVNSYTDISQKQSNRPYIYKIRATNGISNSNYSNEAGSVTPYTGNATPALDRNSQITESSPQPLPLKGQKFIDESFGTEILRLTDESDGDVNATAYAYWASFNSDSTRISVIDGGGGAFHYEMNPFSFTINPQSRKRFPRSPDNIGLGAEGIVWSRDNPNIAYATDGKSIWKYDVCDYDTQNNCFDDGNSSNNFQRLIDLSSYLSAYDRTPSDCETYQANLFQMTVSENKSDGQLVFAGSVIACSNRPSYIVWKQAENLVTVTNDDFHNEVHINDTGEFLWIPQDGGSPFNNKVKNVNTDVILDFPNSFPHGSPGHSDVSSQYMVGYTDYICNNCGFPGNKISKWDMTSLPAVSSVKLLGLKDYRRDAHYSMRAKDKNWVTVGMYESTSFADIDEIKDEVFQLNLDGSGKVRRLVHHQTDAYDSNLPCTSEGQQSTPGRCYFATPRANTSPDGRFIAFTSSWGVFNGRKDVFIARIPKAKTEFDFNADTRPEIGVFRPQSGDWFTLNTTNNSFEATSFGSNGDVIAPGDYDGDDEADYAVFRPSNGVWYIQKSSEGFQAISFGTNGDIPVAKDYDGDGKTDVAVFRPDTGLWYWLNSQNNSFNAVSFGQNGDKPVAGDYDGDGKTDFAVFRPVNNYWYIKQSKTNTIYILPFGISSDILIPRDYDGDGKIDIAVFRPSNGNWLIQRSNDGYTSVSFGMNGDIPSPSDFDGDGKADITVFRPSIGNWFILQSRKGFISYTFGANGDIPISSIQ